MAVLPVVIGKDQPVLRKKTARAPGATKEIKKLLKDMAETMKRAEGLGLAAPQVGQSLRVCLTTLGGKVTPMINPDIVWRSEETALDLEGCLSLPEVWLQIPRSIKITVRYLDARGGKQERQLKHLDARVVQHEVDHLEGVLIVDYAA